MRVVMLAARYWPHVGGVERHVEGVAGALRRAGHDVAVVTEAHDATLAERDERDGVEIWRAPRGGVLRKWRWLAAHRGLLDAAGVVHCHDYPTLTRWILPWRLRARVPVCITFHGHEGRFPIAPTIRLERRLAARLANGTICVGDYIPKWYGTKADVVLYGAVDGPRPFEATDAAGRPCAVFVGRLARDTGIVTYIRGLHALERRHGIRLTLDVHGTGPLADAAARLAHELGVDLRMHGVTARPHAVFAANAGGLAFVSGYLAILEAMAHENLPVTCYDTPLKRDYLELMPAAGRFLAIGGTADELAARVAELLAMPADVKQARLASARWHACAHTWERVAGAYERLWARARG